MINDLMSQQFRAMNMAMSTVIDSFYTLQDATSQAVNISALEIAQRELQQIESQLVQFEDEIRQAAMAQSDFNNELREGTSAANGLLGKIGAIASAYLSFQSIKGLVGLSDDMTNTVARLNLINDGLYTTEELQQMIFESAQRTFAPYQDTADMVAKLGLQARNAFANNAEIVAFAEQLNKTFVIAGTHAQGVESVMLQLTQAMAAGKLQGEELNAILDNAQPIVANIQRYLKEVMNIDSSNIKKLASEGIITAEIIKNAMFYAAEETNKAFESMPVTWSQIWIVMQDRAIQALDPVLQKINDIANSERIEGFMNRATASMMTFATVALYALDMMSSVGSFIYDNWNLIAPIVGTATAAIGAYGAALLIAKAATIATTIWTGAKTLALGLMTATSWAGVQATMSLTAAQWGLNTAMMANPIFLVVLAIIALIGVVYLAVGAINHFTDSSISATGIIAGAFMFLYAYIYNIVANLWNTFAALAEFFVNVWKHPIYSVKRLFYNLASNVIDHIIAMTRGWDSFATNFANAIIAGVNMAIKAWNAFIKLLPEQVVSFLGLSVGTEISYRKSITSDLQSLKSYLKNWVGEAPADYWEAPRIEYMNYSEAWNTGYNWGKNLFSGFNLDLQNQEQFKPDEVIKNALNGLNGVQDAIENGNIAGKDTASNTRKLADSADMLEEDLKYLRDAANAGGINRYTTNITVDMRGMQNKISSDMDIDGIIEKIIVGVEESINSLPEGI